MSIRTLFFEAKMRRGRNTLSLFVFSSLFAFGFFAGSPEVKAQPYGSNGWCDPSSSSTACTGTLSVSTPGPRCNAGDIPTVACPLPIGCEPNAGYWSGSTPCGQCLENNRGVYRYEGEVSCNSRGGGGFDGYIDWGTPRCGSAARNYSYDETDFTGPLCENGTPRAPKGVSLGFPPPGGSIFFACLGITAGWTYCGASRDMTPPPSAPTLTFTADSYSLPANGSTVLRWTSQNATSCTASRSPASPVWTGTKGATPNQLYTESTGPLLGGQVYTYTLRCDGASGTSPITRSLNISVALPPLPPIANPISSATCSPAGNSVTISWNAVPTSVMYPLRINDTIDPWGPGPGQGCAFSTSPNDTCLDSIASLSYTRPVVPGHTYQAWMHACRPGQCSPGLRTTPFPFRCNPPTPTVTLIPSVASVSNGGSVSFTWTAINPSSIVPNSCRQSAVPANGQWSGANLPSISTAPQTVSNLTQTTTFNLQCRSTTGAPVNASPVTVTVNALSCTGTRPAGTAFYSNDNTGITVGNVANWQYASPDTARKCEFYCPVGTWNGSTCVVCGQCGSLADHCPDERWDDNCGNRNVCSGGTKDCRKFWKEVAP